MILEIQHETCLVYSEPVSESIAEVRMEPSSDVEQSCRSYSLRLSPPTEVFRYLDGFGNRVDHFNILPPHQEVRILAASVAETRPRPTSLEVCDATWPLDPDSFPLQPLDFLLLRGPVRHTPLLEPLLETLRPRPGMPLAELVHSVAHYIHDHFRYTPDVTLASSPIDDLLRQGQGVCQDFTHLMLALLRSFGVPARYVSGYIHRQAESQSHAWCEVWLPGPGWLGIDPTNERLVDESFVKVAIGRDFTDVSPNRGLFRGRASESISVRVETRALPSLPSLSWQEQLPALHAPLTAILSGRRPRELFSEEDASQQQQQ